MPLGDRQENDLVHITLDVWQDKVYYLGKEYPAGYFAAGVLNVSHNLFVTITGEGGFLLDAYAIAKFGDREQLEELLPVLWESVENMLRSLRQVPPFSLWNMEAELGKMKAMLSKDRIDQLLDNPEEKMWFLAYLRAGILLPISIYHFVIAAWHLETYYLHRLGKRDETHFAVAFHDFYHDPSTKEVLEKMFAPTIEPFDANPRLRSSYTFARDPKDEKKMIFVNRVFFSSYMDFYVYDLLNGMHWGHAPSLCECCLKYFLTTDSHKPKYCDGMAPQNPHYTCRQYGAMNQQKEKNANHPIYRIFKTRTNTIRKHQERGQITEELRNAAIALCEELRDKALLDTEFAQEEYPKRMEQEAVYVEARKRLGGDGSCDQ